MGVAKSPCMYEETREEALPEGWRAALERFDRDLSARGAAERTRRAYGTDDIGSLGSAASHGCVRMSIPDVIELYDKVDVGDPVYVL